MPDEPHPLSPVTIRRLAIGLTQGVALYLMFKAYELKVWPATELTAFQALLLPLLFVPLAAIHADGHLPRRAVFTWLGAAALGCALVGFFDGYRYPHVLDVNTWEPGAMLVGTAFGLFISEALLLAAHADGRRVPSYPTYFDAISKHAVQVVAAAAFTGVLWLLLTLGSELFQLIKLNFLENLFDEEWFSIPVTTLALATAIHSTDMRYGLVHGIRTLALTLLSWLLPVLTLIAAGFLVSLPFTGLQPLWDTRFAAGLLLAVAAALIVLTNAAYQDGAPENQPRTVLKGAMMLAMALPAPLIAIAAHALYLRVAQYGWTTDRVLALACVLIGACFGLGYLAALAKRERLEATNLIASFSAVAVLFSLFTPIVDPARISVSSQMARLMDGRISAEMFDYKYLRFEGGRYGAAALAGMQTGEFKIAGAAERAAQAAALTRRYPGEEPMDGKSLALNIAVADGGALPANFLAQDWMGVEKVGYPNCMRMQAEKCEAVLLDLDADGTEEMVLIPEGADTPPTIFSYQDGRWSRAGSFPRRLACEDMRTLLRSGALSTAPSRWPDLEIGGLRMEIAERTEYEPQECPETR